MSPYVFMILSFLAVVFVEVMAARAETRSKADLDRRCQERITTAYRIIGHFERRTLGNLHHGRDRRAKQHGDSK